MTTAAEVKEETIDDAIFNLKTAVHVLRDKGWTESEVRRLTEQTLNEERHDEEAVSR